MLGYDLEQLLSAKHELTALGHTECDITDTESVESIMRTVRPDYVINAAAATHVDGCEDAQDMAYAVNGDAPGILAASAKKCGAGFLHFSTDYVFDGKNEAGYAENDEPNPLGIYGKSKLKGEINALSENPKTIIARVCWLFGKNRTNFVDFLINATEENTPVKLINDQFGHPSYTKDLAAGSLTLIEEERQGIFHLFNSGVASRAEQARYVFEVLGKTPPAEEVSLEVFAAKAPRPIYSILKNTKLPQLRSWKEAISDYIRH